MNETNAIFDEMVEGLQLGTNEDAFVDYRKLTRLELSTRFNATREQLYELGEVRYPRTDLGRDLSAVYHGLLIEMRRRGIL